MLLPNSYTYMPQDVQDCRLPGLKPSKRFRRPPRQQLLQLLHAPAICFSGGSRLPFARPQTPQALPTLSQASKATTLTATCPCHLFFRGFKTAVCPPSNPPNASNAPAGLQGNNSYSYMSSNPPNASNLSQASKALPSVFQGVQDCRLPALKPPKRFQRSRRPPRQQLLQLHVLKPSKRFQPSRRPPRQQLLQLHAPAICFSRGSRLPFARPQTPQTLPTLSQASKATTLTATCPTLPQASKATTLTATCPCHLCFRGFKTAVCLAPNPPNASNPPAGLQGNNSYSYMPLPSVFQGVQDCRLPALKPPNASNAPAGLQGNNSYSYMSLPSVFQGVQDCRRKHSYMPLPSVFQGVQDCRLPGLKPPKRFQRSRRPPRQQLLQLHAPAICFSGGSRLPFARPQTPQTLPTLPQASKATTLTATCPCKPFFKRFQTARRRPPRHTAICFSGVQDPANASARLSNQQLLQLLHAPANCFSGGSRPPRQQLLQLHVLKPSKRFQPSRRPPRQQLLQLHAPAICFSGGSRLPFARPQTPQTLPTLSQASKATTLTATCPTLPQASEATTLTATCPCHLFFRGFKTAVCPAPNPPNASNPPAGLQGNNSYSYMPLPSVFQGVQDCRLPALKPPKRFQRSRRPPRQQLLQLHVPAICFSGGSRLPSQAQLHAPAICFSRGSRLPFARPQTLQTLPALPQASKATTLTATCPCHLFFRGFKTAVCPPSNPPNASNAPAGLQGNNSYSYMSLPSVFQGVQDCRRKQRHTQRLPGLKPSKRFRTPPRQQLLQLLHAPAICFSGGLRLPFARPQTPQTLPTLPQASKATTLTATCPCHLFFTGFKTAVCPASNVPNASNAPAGLQGNNSYSYPLSATCPRHLPCSCRTLTPTCPRTFKTAVCPASNPPNASNAPAGLQGNNSYSYMSLPSVFQGVQDCRRKQRHTQRLPGLKPSKRFCTPPRQQLLQLLHAPAICFSGGSRLPFARPQPPQTLPTLPQASKATTLTATCPCHMFFTGFKTAVCSPSTPPNASNPPAGLQGNNSYSYMPLPSVFQGVQDCRLPALKPPKRFQRSRRPPRQQLLQLHVPAICFSGGSRLPSQAKAHAIKATPLSATCPAIYMLLPNSYTYMPLPPVFQDVQDYRLPGLKPSKRFRRPPRQQLLQLLHAPAICFSGGSRLPFARLQTPQTLPTLPQASKATTLTATCPCHLFFRGFKTAVCPPSNPPNASNAPAGLQGNNSCSYMSLPSVFQGVQDCRLLGLKPPKRFQPSRRPPRQQLLQLHAPAICFSGGSRLPFARPQTPQTLRTLPALSRSALCPKEGGVGGTRALARFIYSYIPSLGGHYHGSTH